MKTSKIATLVMLGLALSATPALAQRGGSNRGGGGSHSSSSMSRGGGGSSSRGSSFSSPSRSSSSVSSSRSTSSYSSPSRSSSSVSRSSSSTSAPSRSMGTPSRSSSTRSFDRSSQSPSRSAAAAARSSATRAAGSADGFRSGRPSGTRESLSRGGNPAPTQRSTASGAGVSSHGTPIHNNPAARNGGYARPGHPGGALPPSHRPIRPAPYFHHPWHGYVVHCHPIFWDPIPLRPLYWPGFWHYCHSYWYDYHVTDVVVVRQYVQDTYKVDMVTYGISGDIMYAIVRDHGDTFLQVYDKDDHLLAEQKINKRYCNMVIDADNGGCWISKKNNKDALLFLWADGQLLIYEAD